MPFTGVMGETGRSSSGIKVMAETGSAETQASHAVGAPLEQRRHTRRKQVIVVLPAYNEEENLGPLLERLDDDMREEGIRYSVIVVDDGSTDGTVEVLRRYEKTIPLTIERHTVNQGLGETIRDGLMLAAKKASNEDIVITMDADETHTPGLIRRMVRMIREGHDVVIASRYQNGARVFGLSHFRRFLSYAASWMMRMVFPTPGVRDFTCGYRAYRGETLKTAVDRYGKGFVSTTGFNCMVDILLKMRKMKIIFGEVPMILRYDLKRGKTKMRVWRTTRQTLMLMAKRRLGIEG
jgi:dolichol-phosphate mannosyltransferase